MRVVVSDPASGGSIDAFSFPTFCVRRGPAQTAGNQTIGRNFHPKKSGSKIFIFVEKTWF